MTSHTYVRARSGCCIASVVCVVTPDRSKALRSSLDPNTIICILLALSRGEC